MIVFDYQEAGADKLKKRPKHRRKTDRVSQRWYCGRTANGTALDQAKSWQDTASTIRTENRQTELRDHSSVAEQKRHSPQEQCQTSASQATSWSRQAVSVHFQSKKHPWRQFAWHRRGFFLGFFPTIPLRVVSFRQRDCNLQIQCYLPPQKREIFIAIRI